MCLVNANHNLQSLEIEKFKNIPLGKKTQKTYKNTTTTQLDANFNELE